MGYQPFLLVSQFCEAGVELVSSLAQALFYTAPSNRSPTARTDPETPDCSLSLLSFRVLPKLIEDTLPSAHPHDCILGFTLVFLGDTFPLCLYGPPVVEGK